MKRLLIPKDTLNCCAECGSCLNICSSKAIKWSYDNPWERRPIIDQLLCVDCGMCAKACPIVNNVPMNKPLEIYAAVHTNEQVRLNSSSSGAFYSLASSIINDGGVVFGCAWNGTTAVHIKVETIDDLHKLQKSKYVQSETRDIFKTTKKELEKGRKVLFSGTPCQVSALKLFLSKDYINLLTADLVCHGAPSKSILDDYISYLRFRYMKPINSIDFRHKIPNVGVFLTRIDIPKGRGSKSIVKPWQGSSYSYLFMKGYIYRDYCYKCKFATQSRVSDITFGDFWGAKAVIPSIDDSLGVSLILINTQKGINCKSVFMNSMLLYDVGLSDACSNNAQLTHPSIEPADREILKSAYLKYGYKGINSFYRKKWIEIIKGYMSFYYVKLVPIRVRRIIKRLREK